MSDSAAVASPAASTERVSVFQEYHERNYPFRYKGALLMDSIAGGVPLNPNVLEGHIKRKIDAPDDLVRAHVAKIIEDRAEEGVTYEEAVEEAAKNKGMVGFAKDETSLYVPGAHLKACIVEAACIAAAAGRIKARGWGQTSSNKGIQSWLAEHIFVIEDKLSLGVDEPTEVNQSFIHKKTAKGPISAVQYTEIVRGCEIPFTLETDHGMDDADWAAIWTTAEHNAFGASRKRGYGTFKVVEWTNMASGKLPKAKASSNGSAAVEAGEAVAASV
jgi:hypothetical protein